MARVLEISGRYSALREPVTRAEQGLGNSNPEEKFYSHRTKNGSCLAFLQARAGPNALGQASGGRGITD